MEEICFERAVDPTRMSASRSRRFVTAGDQLHTERTGAVSTGVGHGEETVTEEVSKVRRWSEAAAEYTKSILWIESEEGNASLFEHIDREERMRRKRIPLTALNYESNML